MSGTTNQTVAAEFEGLKVPMSPFVASRVKGISNGNYERPERKLASKLTREGDRVVEFGTGIGFVGGFTAFKKKNLQLRSFEGNPDLVPLARKLYQINGIDDRATVENKLVMANPESPEFVTFHVHRSFLGSAIASDQSRGYKKVDVPTLAWDELNADFAPDVIIMDIEGAELDFLTHADLSAVRAVIFEVHPRVYGKEGEAACLEALRAQGFKQAHHRMQVYSFVADGVEVPR